MSTEYYLVCKYCKIYREMGKINRFDADTEQDFLFRHEGHEIVFFSDDKFIEYMLNNFEHGHPASVWNWPKNEYDEKVFSSLKPKS